LKNPALSFLVLLTVAALPAMAATVTCPDLGKALQIASCPAEEELKHTYTGFCSDDAKAYKGETDVCKDYRLYRKLKNVALWESGDGAFSAYVSCDLSPDGVKAAKVSGIRVLRQGKINQLVCSYGEGLSFSYRTREECRIEAADCATAPATCKANCN
jgi:hypothetical protein